MNINRQLYVYVDVDDTLVRSFGTKRVSIPSVIEHVRKLASAGVELYCWSTAGAEYARSTARELGIETCFLAFLPKPNIMIDDQDIAQWKRFRAVHPFSISGETMEQYLSAFE